jgi:hypothetical protein
LLFAGPFGPGSPPGWQATGGTVLVESAEGASLRVSVLGAPMSGAAGAFTNLSPEGTFTLDLRAAVDPVCNRGGVPPGPGCCAGAAPTSGGVKSP